MTSSSSTARPRQLSAIMMGSVHRRRITLVVLLSGLPLSAVLFPFVPALALSMAAIFTITLGIDLVLLRRRQILLAERSMKAAFRSRRPVRSIR
jgi:hypothetical protein